MNLKDLGHAIAGMAPLVGTALGGPAGGVVGTLIASVFGGSASDPDNLWALIQKDPEAAIKLKQMELDNQAKLQDIALQNYQTEVDDRKDARKNKTELVDIIAIFFIIGFFTFEFLYIYKVIQYNESIFMGLQNALMLILSFYFGSSRGERLSVNNQSK